MLFDLIIGQVSWLAWASWACWSVFAKLILWSLTSPATLTATFVIVDKSNATITTSVTSLVFLISRSALRSLFRLLGRPWLRSFIVWAITYLWLTDCLTLLGVPVAFQALAPILFASLCFGSDCFVSVLCIIGLSLLTDFKRVIFGHHADTLHSLVFVLRAPIVFTVLDFVREIRPRGSFWGALR